MTYNVELDAFHGPLDLLLYLVKKEEVDVLEIPIARLADQFLAYLRSLRELDFELAGDFLVMAATLMEIKSRSLLPGQESTRESIEAADPRKELVRQLLEYRKFKEAAAALEQQAEAHSTRHGREAIEDHAPNSTAVKPVELWDLVSAFARLMRETQTAHSHAVVVDETPQHVYEAYIQERLAAESPLPFRELFGPPHTRGRLIGLFLATLELIKRRIIDLSQADLFGDIRLSLRARGAE